MVFGTIFALYKKMRVKMHVTQAICVLLLVSVGCAAEHDYTWQLPPGFPIPNVPADNPMSEAKVALGKKLFFDPILSANGTQSCASCHMETVAFSDPRKVSAGSTGQLLPRQSMSLINIAYATHLTWQNPSLTSLEAQLHVPLFAQDPIELGFIDADALVVAFKAAGGDYPTLFEQAFAGGDITMSHIEKAVAAFERTLIAGDSPFDRYQRGEKGALSTAALRGHDLFFGDALRCSRCHGGFTFANPTDANDRVDNRSGFANNGLHLPGDYDPENEGVFAHTGQEKDRHLFKIPTLRNIALTEPYMHDGSLSSLEEVVDFYATGGKAHPNKDELVAGFTLDETQKSDLIAFLEALTSQ